MNKFQITRGVSCTLKIVAALLVMFSHYCNIKATGGEALNSIEWLIRSQGGNVGVAIFFFLSGYGLMMSELKSHLPLKSYLKRRFLKIYLPIVLVTAIWLPISYFMTDNYNSGGIWLVVRDLAIGFRDPVLWFIKSLIILYAAFYIFSVWLYKGEVVLAFVTFWILTIATCVVSYFTNGSFGLSSMSGIPLFSVGVISAYYSTRFYKRFNVAFIPLVVSLMLLSLVFTFHPRFVANIVHSIADYAIVGTLILIFSNYQPNFKIPSVLAAITFDIYLVHFKILIVIKETDFDLSLGLFIAATAIASVGSYLLRSRLLKF